MHPRPAGHPQLQQLAHLPIAVHEEPCLGFETLWYDPQTRQRPVIGASQCPGPTFNLRVCGGLSVYSSESDPGTSPARVQAGAQQGRSTVAACCPGIGPALMRTVKGRDVSFWFVASQ